MKAEQPSRRWPNAFRRARPPDFIRTESFCPVSGPLPYEKPVSVIAQCQCLLRSCCRAEQGPMLTEEHLGGRFAAVASFGAGDGCAAFGSQEKTVLAALPELCVPLQRLWMPAAAVCTGATTAQGMQAAPAHAFPR